MRFGVCGSTVVPGSSGVEIVERASKAGYDYVELSLSHISALTEETFGVFRARVKDSGIPCEACNNFYPPSIRLTGPEVRWGAVQDYTRLALGRALALGARVVVFGSSGAKNVPPGFPMEKALDQIVAALRFVAEEAGPRGIVIVIEPLNRQESNIVNNLTEALALMGRVDRPEVRVLVDYYHSALERDTPEALRRAGPHLRHVHVARVEGRTYPTGEDPGLRAFFQHLSSVGYGARVSIEGATADFDRDGPRSLGVLREMASAEPPSG